MLHTRLWTNVPPPTGSLSSKSMPATVIVGAQWGDEGKGKIVDLLAADRRRLPLPGRPERGHTIVVDGQRFVLRLVPSGSSPGALRARPGLRRRPGLLVDELDELVGRGLDRRPLRLERAPDHALARRRRLRAASASRTPPDRHDAPGIGPAYEDKAARIGIRVRTSST